MITFSRNTIRIGEIYCRSNIQNKPKHIDLIRFVGFLQPDQKAVWYKSHTLIIKLDKSKEELLKGMDSGTRYEIRRAQSKDSLVCIRSNTDDEEEISRFCDYYDDFAKVTSLRRMFRPRMYALALRRKLLITSICDAGGEILVQHAHLIIPERLMLLYSASQFRRVNDSTVRALIGRANRLLHWSDMLTARDEGALLYDMCGVDMSKKSPETTRITQFKLGFGGTVVPYYSRTMPCSLKGCMVHMLLRSFGKTF